MKTLQKVWWILKRSDGKILIFQEFSQKKDRYFWNIVKGTTEETNKNPYDTLAREIFEETWLIEVVLWPLFDTVPKIERNTIIHLSVFEVQVLGDGAWVSNKNMMDDESIKEYRWIDRDAFETIPKEDFMDDRIYRVLEKYFSS